MQIVGFLMRRLILTSYINVVVVFCQRPSALAKIVGVYRIGFRNQQTNNAMKQDLLVVENLFYNRNISQVSTCSIDSLFVLRLKHPSQQFFSHVVMEPMLPGFNQYCRELMCLAQGHNTVPPVGIKPRTS